MIIVRKYFSSKYAETEEQAKKRESDAAKLALSTGGLGAAFEGGIDREKGKGKIKFDIVDGVGAGGSITVQFKN